MAISNAALLTGGPTTIFTCPGPSQEHAVTCIIFCNTDTVDRNLDVYVLKTGQSIATDPQTQIIKSLTVPTGETFTFDTEKLVLESNDSIACTCSAGTGSLVMTTVSSLRVS